MVSLRQRVFRRCIIALTGILLVIPAAAQDTRGLTAATERLALVIGNGAYPSAPLRNPVNDAQDMSRTLSQMGFNVVLKENVDRRAMEDAIRSFGRQLRNGGVGLFYFAGHGMQVEGRNYLIPVNSRIESESDVKYEAVDAGLILGKMEDARNQVNIIILDACRNNPYSRNFRNTDQGLARMDAPKGSVISYSTAPGEVAADGPERNGIFTKHLIRHMQTPHLPIEQVLKRVRIDVSAETSQRQIPWESSSLMTDFYFKTDKKTEASGPHPPGAPTAPPREPLLASTPKSEAAVSPISETKPSLAIFPIYFSGRGRVQQQPYYEQAKSITIESVKQVMAGNRDFSSIHTYYDLPKELEYRKIPPEIINEKTSDELWRKEGLFATKSNPNIPQLVHLGKKLGVDNIFLIDCGGDIELYIVDVNSGTVFSREVFYVPINAYSEIPKQMNAFFAAYKDHLKNR